MAFLFKPRLSVIPHTPSAQIPQVWTVWKAGNAEGLSLTSLLLQLYVLTEPVVYCMANNFPVRYKLCSLKHEHLTGRATDITRLTSNISNITYSSYKMLMYAFFACVLAHVSSAPGVRECSLFSRPCLWSSWSYATVETLPKVRA